MSQDPHTPSENTGLPPRHRVSLEKLRSETTETDLWDLDGLDAEPPQGTHSPDDQIGEIPWQEIPTEQQPVHEGEIYQEHEIPVGEYTHEAHYPQAEEYLHEEHAPEHDHAIESDYTGHEHDHETHHPEAAYTSTQLPDVFSEEIQEYPDPETAGETRRLPHDELGELEDIDDWDDTDVPMPEIQEPVEYAPTAPTTAEDSGDTAEITPPVDDQLHVPQHQAQNKHRGKSLALNEIIAISSAGIGLCLVAGFFLINAFSGLPRITDPRKQPDLPAKGEHFAVTKVNSYWRAPVTSGPEADTIQRGIELIPVVEVSTSGGSAALRLQFRNSEGAAVGDPITHAVSGESSLVIPSTAGLEDANIHNAYRTGLIDPWTVEILEASAGTTLGSAFRSIVTVPILPDRR